MRRLIGAVVILCLITSLTAALVHAEEERNTMERNIRKPAVAGQFYTADPAALEREITAYLENVDIDEAPAGRVIAIVSPHAGYLYSGGVAAHGYSIVRGEGYKTVVVIAPSHVEYFDFCSLFPGEAYLTPLGEIPVDREMIDLIASKHELLRTSEKGHSIGPLGRGEHSLEVQLPFLQVALGRFELVPIVMGSQNHETILALGKALGESLRGKEALIVASTDLSHFHPDSRAKELDGVFIESLEAFEPERLHESVSEKETEACGGGPTIAAMIAAEMLGATGCRVLAYATSGDVTGDRSNVVGYVSAVMTGDENSARSERRNTRESENDTEKSYDIGLTREEKAYLLTLARRTIESSLGKETRDPPALQSPVLDKPCGAFVTLSKKGTLRGCIGYIEAVKPLRETIAEMAESAAFKDWRFPPLRESELDEIEIEISVLSPLRRIDDPSLIEVGTHGIIISRGSNRGLLLPQVAVEWGWDRQTFLRQTCIKAGLPEEAWSKEGTTIDIFSADIFNEHDLDREI